MGSVRWLSADIELRCGNIGRTSATGRERGRLPIARARCYTETDLGEPLASRLDRLDQRLEHAAEHELTPAELRILSFVPTHLSRTEIAARLDLSRATVKTTLRTFSQQARRLVRDRELSRRWSSWG